MDVPPETEIGHFGCCRPPEPSQDKNGTKTKESSAILFNMTTTEGITGVVEEPSHACFVEAPVSCALLL